LASVEPPTKIIETPAPLAFAAVLLAWLGEKSSGSIKAAQIGPFLVLWMRSFSTGPMAIKSCPGFGIIVYEGVVDVDVRPLRHVTHFPAGMKGAIRVAACDAEYRIL